MSLPHLLRDGLDAIFVGINPSVYSVERGHYFSRKSNKFWPCVSRSALTLRMRETLGVDRLGPEDDVRFPEFGIGFTDLVERPTVRASELAAAEFAAGVALLAAKLERYRPRVACFQGTTSIRHVRRALGLTDDAPAIGPQTLRLAGTALFVVPNPSGANAHVTRAEQTAWYDELARFLEGVPTPPRDGVAFGDRADTAAP